MPHGDECRYVTIGDAATRPSSRLVVLRDAGYPVLAERALEVDREITSFLKPRYRRLR